MTELLNGPAQRDEEWRITEGTGQMGERNNTDDREAQERERATNAYEWASEDPRRAVDIMKAIFGDLSAAFQPAQMAENIIDDVLVRDPTNPPDVRMLSGYLGASTRDNTTRLYANLDLSRYLEIPNESIYHTMSIPTEHSVAGLPYSKVWVKTGAQVIRVSSDSVQMQQQFLRGDIAGSIEGWCDCGQGTPCSCGRAQQRCCVCFQAPTGRYGGSAPDDPWFEYSSRSPC